MREHKYRVWNKIKKEWGRGGWIGDIYCWDGVFDLGKQLEIEGLELVEFTGLKDKNGVEIYEGDIVAGNIDGYKDGVKIVVEWDDFSTGFSPFSDNCYGDPLVSIDKDRGVIGVEVIGNVWENPEPL